MRKMVCLFLAFLLFSGPAFMEPVGAIKPSKPPKSVLSNDAAERALIDFILKIEARDVEALTRPDLAIYTDKLGSVNGPEELNQFFDELTLIEGTRVDELIPFKNRRLAVLDDRTLILSLFANQRILPAEGGGTKSHMYVTYWLVQFKGEQIVSFRSAEELKPWLKIND